METCVETEIGFRIQNCSGCRKAYIKLISANSVTDFGEIRHLNIHWVSSEFRNSRFLIQSPSHFTLYLTFPMKKIYYLSTCDTCRDIIKRFHGLPGFNRQDIKTDPITEEQLKELKALAGTYEALFSKRAVLYREMNLKDRLLSEADYRKLILKEYTFLKRPVIVFEDQIFIGNEKATVAAAEKAILG